MRLLLALVFASVATVLCRAQVPTETDVCSVLSQPLQFNGTMIAVRGIAHSANDGLVVGSDACLKRLILDKVTFRNEIAVEESTGNHVPFSTDKTSLAKLNSILAASETQYVSGTFVGLFETRVPLGGLVLGHGLIEGYGNTGRLPGRLILQEVRNISVEAKPPAPQIHTVCELLADPLTFNGKLIAVRGAIRGGGWMFDDQCLTHITVRGHSFQNLIAVRNPTDLTRIHDVAFDRDDQSLALITKAFGESNDGHPRVVATLVGVFETRDQLNLVAENGVSVGFGHLGAAPAQLLVKECIQVTTEYVPLR